MEKEDSREKSHRYSENEFYNNLKEQKYPICYDLFSSVLLKVAPSMNEEKLLECSDILLEFGIKETDDPIIKEKVIETMVDGLFKFLKIKIGRKQNAEVVKKLVSEEYPTILENLQVIGEESHGEIAQKCISGIDFLTFPENVIIEQGELDS